MENEASKILKDHMLAKASAELLATKAERTDENVMALLDGMRLYDHRRGWLNRLAAVVALQQMFDMDHDDAESVLAEYLRRKDGEGEKHESL